MPGKSWLLYEFFFKSEPDPGNIIVMELKSEIEP